MEEVVSIEKIEELADLFDRSVNALDPESRDSKEAAAFFDQEIEELHQKIPPGSGVSLAIFRARIRTRCRQFLHNKNN